MRESMNQSEKNNLLKTLKDYDLTLLCLNQHDPKMTKAALAKLKALVSKSQDALIIYAKK